MASPNAIDHALQYNGCKYLAVLFNWKLQTPVILPLILLRKIQPAALYTLYGMLLAPADHRRSCCGTAFQGRSVSDASAQPMTAVPGILQVHIEAHLLSPLSLPPVSPVISDDSFTLAPLPCPPSSMQNTLMQKTSSRFEHRPPTVPCVRATDIPRPSPHRAMHNPPDRAGWEKTTGSHRRRKQNTAYTRNDRLTHPFAHPPCVIECFLPHTHSHLSHATRQNPF
ncbi:hypothetical protein BJ166DRAFT_284515 [Pestalotiopsis sp. NC0098]|nr:hypothetical protein BJ166DRAFT_284515 [Pestalotiopsis sp. NC0098]